MRRNAERNAAIDETMQRVRALAGRRPVDRELLAEIARELQQLAARPGLFSGDDFPGPAAGDNGVVRYLLAAEPDDTFALYLNSIDAGKSSPPHNHTTWAVIVALEGNELNRIYQRESATADGRAKLQLASEVLVTPGNTIQFMPDDIHSIHIEGDRPTRHFHLYGRALEVLHDRVAFDLQNGEVLKFNQNFMDAPRVMPR